MNSCPVSGNQFLSKRIDKSAGYVHSPNGTRFDEVLRQLLTRKSAIVIGLSEDDEWHCTFRLCFAGQPREVEVLHSYTQARHPDPLVRQLAFRARDRDERNAPQAYNEFENVFSISAAIPPNLHATGSAGWAILSAEIDPIGDPVLLPVAILWFTHHTINADLAFGTSLFASLHGPLMHESTTANNGVDVELVRPSHLRFPDWRSQRMSARHPLSSETICIWMRAFHMRTKIA